MRKKLATLLCSGFLSVMVLSSVAMAAPANRASCSHNWVERNVETVNVVVESNHQCTICGARINLYKKAQVVEDQCTKCDKWRGNRHQKDPEGPTFSTHPCYN